ncbi:MAG: 4-hydroxy-3-methylbut-2-enyl diphosphate reductase [Alphaproteobacteria bacterium MarineAlpha9_Bin1]|nr:MAG: 4-hydroxy-3-methylbut-2-enyl diphosphate reductase [Alphaproteobacteria bacterium MarineAlpha9_Bin1]
MKIRIAKDAGYCFGVRDAVNLAYDTAEKYGDVYMLGDIVHNERVVKDLNNQDKKTVFNGLVHIISTT